MMEKKITAYNLRVYGLLMNKRKELLLSKETRKGFSFTKFPGGGHQFGESLTDCLERELREELNLEVDQLDHYYTTDVFQRSAFSEKEQLISVYYFATSSKLEEIENGKEAMDTEVGNKHHFYWKSLDNLEEGELTFPVDRIVLRKLKSEE